MSAEFFSTPRRALVRRGYSEDDDWRSALPREPLHMFVTVGGPLDAPEVMPAGSMKRKGPSYAFREG